MAGGARKKADFERATKSCFDLVYDLSTRFCHTYWEHQCVQVHWPLRQINSKLNGKQTAKRLFTKNTPTSHLYDGSVVATAANMLTCHTQAEVLATARPPAS